MQLILWEERKQLEDVCRTLHFSVLQNNSNERRNEPYCGPTVCRTH